MDSLSRLDHVTFNSCIGHCYFTYNAAKSTYDYIVTCLGVSCESSCCEGECKLLRDFTIVKYLVDL